MRRTLTYEFDNRDSSEMFNYLEARIDAMRRRISELENENAKLRCVAEDAQYQLVPTV